MFETPIQILAHYTGGREAAFAQARNLPEEWAGQTKTRIWPTSQPGPAFIFDPRLRFEENLR